MCPKIVSILFPLLFLFQWSHAQHGNGYVVVSKFKVEGNRRTKKATLLRELDFRLGDTIRLDELAPRMAKNQTLLLNTGLFYEVDMNVEEWDALNNVAISIKVREAWYIYPIPIFELSDRNFNVWWRDYNHSLKRVDYGIRLYFYNVTGRRDLLKLVFQTGFTQKYELNYRIPFIDKNKTWGMDTDFLFATNKEINITTLDNKQIFVRNNDKIMRRRLRAGIAATYQPGLYQRHRIHSQFYYRSIVDTVVLDNPDYLLDGRDKQRFLTLGYTYQLDRRDIRAYPLNGHFLSGNMTKEGIGFFKDRNALIFNSVLAYFKQFGKNKKFGIVFINKNRLQFLRGQPAYYDNRALGYEEDFLRGYEYYVIDGLDYFSLKSSLRYEVFKKLINWKKTMPFKAFRRMPFQIYLNLNADAGYVNDPHYNENNPLANRFLAGGGLGLDFVLYVDKIIRVEYSVNHLKEWGLYLHYDLFF